MDLHVKNDFSGLQEKEKANIYFVETKKGFLIGQCSDHTSRKPLKVLVVFTLINADVLS